MPVLPCTVDTPDKGQAMPNADLGRWVTPEGIADGMLFLASEVAAELCDRGLWEERG